MGCVSSKDINPAALRKHLSPQLSGSKTMSGSKDFATRFSLLTLAGIDNRAIRHTNSTVDNLQYYAVAIDQGKRKNGAAGRRYLAQDACAFKRDFDVLINGEGKQWMVGARQEDFECLIAPCCVSRVDQKNFDLLLRRTNLMDTSLDPSNL